MLVFPRASNDHERDRCFARHDSRKATSETRKAISEKTLEQDFAVIRDIRFVAHAPTFDLRLKASELVGLASGWVEATALGWVWAGLDRAGCAWLGLGCMGWDELAALARGWAVLC